MFYILPTAAEITAFSSTVNIFQPGSTAVKQANSNTVSMGENFYPFLVDPT
jgi:hypothetical protein